jgi:hypothetical protein
MLDVVTFKWRPAWSHYRSRYDASHVNTLRDMVARHYQKPHRFTCITDDPAGIDPRVRIVPLWDDWSSLRSTHGYQNPSCFRRLRLFARDAGELIGPRFVWLDLDMVITADLAPLFDRSEDVILWEGTAGRFQPYNGSMVMMTAGARPQVWERFEGEASARAAQANRFSGSDQAWIAYCLGPGEATFTALEGCYSWRKHLRWTRGLLPPDARIVNFAGSGGDPWELIKIAPWIGQHWRRDAECSLESSTAA